MKNQGGFTLVELVVTILIFGVAIGSISSIFVIIKNVQQQTYYYDTANRAAARQIEALRNNSYASLTAGQTINFTPELPANLPNRSGIATVSAPTEGLRRVDATVTYKAGGQTRSVTVSSLIGEIGITQ